jgi:hypothetical protein
MQAPVHISQGESVVYIVAPLYAEAGRRPAFSRAEISAWFDFVRYDHTVYLDV